MDGKMEEGVEYLENPTLESAEPKSRTTGGRDIVKASGRKLRNNLDQTKRDYRLIAEHLAPFNPRVTSFRSIIVMMSKTFELTLL